MICTLDSQWANQSEIDDVYFKYHCFYNAQTELYDRTLTDERDKYDPTSAFIGSCGEIRSLSNLNATLTYYDNTISNRTFNCLIAEYEPRLLYWESNVWVAHPRSYQTVDEQNIISWTKVPEDYHQTVKIKN